MDDNKEERDKMINLFDEIPDYSEVPNWYKWGVFIFTIVIFILTMVRIYGGK